MMKVTTDINIKEDIAVNTSNNKSAVNVAVECIKKLDDFGIDWRSEADKAVPGHEKSLMYLGEENEEIFLRRVVGGFNGTEACKLILKQYDTGNVDESLPINYSGI